MDIAEKIKFLRNNLNISQDNFAKLLSVSKTTIKNWENGTSKPTTANIMLIANICHVTVDYLIFDNHPLEIPLNNTDDEAYEILDKLIQYYNKEVMNE